MDIGDVRMGYRWENKGVTKMNEYAVERLLEALRSLTYEVQLFREAYVAHNSPKVEDEPQTCSVNGRPYDCGNCEYFKCTADEPQTEVIMPKKCKGCDSASKIIEAYSKGFEDGADAIKAMPQTYKPTCNGECRNCDYRAKDGNYCMKTDCSWK